jgi:translocation and assembly module TamA
MGFAPATPIRILAMAPRAPLALLKRALLTGLAAGVITLAGPAAAQAPPGEEEEAAEEQQEPQRPQFPYEVSVEPVEDAEDLTAALENAANLVSLAEEPPPGPAGLIRRARSDLERLRSVLESYGHYRGRVDITIAGLPLGDPDLLQTLSRREGEEPVQVTISADPGPQFTIEEVVLQPPAGGGPLPDIDRAALGIAAGDPARAEPIIRAENRLVGQLRERGHPFAEVPSRRAVVDFSTNTMRVTYTVAAGPQATMGPVSFQGLEDVNERLVRNRIPFEPGDPFRPGRLDALRSALSELEVFSTIRISPADRLNDEGQLPLTVELQERLPRFVGFGVNFATSEGLGATAFWGHRNLFGGAERLRISGEVGRLLENDLGDTEYALNIDFQKPDFLQPYQTLIAEAGATAERTDAFDREAVFGSVGIERPVTPELTLGAGLSFTQETVTDAQGERDFTLVGIPLTLRYDNTDNLLNPTEGFRARVDLTPFPSAIGSFDNLLIGDVSGATYYDFGTDGNTVLAGRARVGMIFGPGTSDIPASRRFYAGGGGSVRGYDFQSIGPEDQFGDPFGGRSLVTINLELRQRILDSWGLVGFVDGGNVYDSSLPDFEDTLRFGAGVGVRYYTDFGPIRLDLATPINPESDDDQPPVSVYISIGQSF